MSKLVPLLTENMPKACVSDGIANGSMIGEIIGLTGQSQIGKIRDLPGMTQSWCLGSHCYCWTRGICRCLSPGELLWNYFGLCQFAPLIYLDDTVVAQL